MSRYTLFSTSDGSVMDKRTPGVAVSGTTTYYSKPVSGAFAGGFSLHLVWTGTPNGAFTVWKSNKPDPVLTDDADWVQDLEFNATGSVAASGSADEFGCSAFNANNALWRVKYVNASSTGTIFCWATLRTKG